MVRSNYKLLGVVPFSCMLAQLHYDSPKLGNSSLSHASLISCHRRKSGSVITASSYNTHSPVLVIQSQDSLIFFHRQYHIINIPGIR